VEGAWQYESKPFVEEKVGRIDQQIDGTAIELAESDGHEPQSGGVYI